MGMGIVRVGLIGAGRIGQLHAANIVRHIRHAKLVAVADIKEEAAKKIALEYGIPKIRKDFRAVVEDPEVDAVLICTSTETHAEIIRAAAAAHKHIFCEKPLALDLKEIDEILEIVQKNNVKLQVGFNRRFDPHFLAAKEVILSGKLGRLNILKITSRDPTPPSIDYIKVSGGIFLDMTIHDFDMARFLMGEEAVEIYATGAVLVDPQIGEAGDIDTAIVVLRFQSGALGVIDNSRRAVYGYDQRVEVFGEHGMVKVENPRLNQAVLLTKGGEQASTLPYFFIERYTESYIRELSVFIQTILEGKDPPVTGWDGKMAVVMGYAAKRSLEEGRPVRLSEIMSTFC